MSRPKNTIGDFCAGMGYKRPKTTGAGYGRNQGSREARKPGEGTDAFFRPKPAVSIGPSFHRPALKYSVQMMEALERAGAIQGRMKVG